MTNSLSPPLEINYDQIDPIVLEAIRKVDEIANQHEARYFLAGATAREVILRHVFGRPPGRRTLDVDFGIAVRDWNHFNTLKSSMQQAGFAPHPHKIHRLTYNSTPAVVVDLIPFGGVESADRTIAWPPEQDIVMSVTGFSDGLESAIPVRLEENLVVPVVSIPVLLVLKLLAWVDRKSEKRDAADIHTLLKEYGDAGNEDRLYGEELNILEAEGYDFELAGARLIGRDAARVISPDTRNRVRAILESEPRMAELTNQIIVLSVRSDAIQIRRCESLVSKLRHGFLGAE
jgi:predicted nucleotidyltransferase